MIARHNAPEGSLPLRPVGVRAGIGALVVAFAVACGGFPTEPPGTMAAPVFAKPGSTSPPLRLVMPGTLTDGTANASLSDGLASVLGAPSGSYDDGVCGVQVARDGDTTAALYFRPAPFPTYKPKPGSGCPPSPRAAYVQLGPATLVHLSDDPHQDTSLGALGLVSSDQLFSLGSQYIRAMTHTISVAERQATFNLAFCLDGGAGKGMRYNAVDYPGSDNMVVTQTSASSWHAQSKPFPDNKAWCTHTNPDGSTVTLIMHLDVATDVVEIP